MKSTNVNIGIIGGGLMGKELASSLGRWFVLNDFPVQAKLTAVCDANPKALDWFRQLPSVTQLTTDYKELLANPEIDVVYVAVPHHLHEELYLAVLDAGKDLLAEKPFGIDLAASERICARIKQTGRFVRCSSEFPFFPGVQAAYQVARSGKLGKLLEVHSGFWHSSDLDPTKPINWKRQTQFCGKIGVMGDLGMHAVHIPARLGWIPDKIYAQLQKVYHERPDGKGGMAPCDTWDNAMLHGSFSYESTQVPIRFEMKRLAPGETNTWFIEILGTDGGVRFSTKDPKALWTFHRNKEQSWQRTDLGYGSVFPTITGGIFEHGFPDCFLQMWAAFLAERAGLLGDKFGCVTPEEALLSHRLFAAALRSHETESAAALG
jgi:predicted dehydrogenase